MPNEFIARNGLIALNNTTITGSLSIGGTQTATGSIARAIFIGPVLSASANSDNLITLDIQPTYNTGSFTGVSRTAIRFPNQTYFQSANTSGTYYNIFGVDINNFAFFGNASLNAVFAGSNLSFSGNVISFAGGGSATFMQVKASTSGNTAFGNYSFTLPDNGYRVQVYASNAVSGSLYISGSASQILTRIDSDVSSSILFISGSGRIGIGTVNPTGSLHIVDGGIGAISSLQVNTSFRVTGDGQIRWGAAMNQGLITWDTGRVMVGGLGSNNLDLTAGAATRARLDTSGNMGIGTALGTISARTHIIGAGTTSATTNFLLQNSTPSTLLTILDNGQYTYSGPLLTLASSQSGYVISQSISSSNTVGGQVYGVNITPTFWQTTASQTETAFRVAATFNTSSVFATGGTNIIADFGASSVGSQLTVTDVTSGSIYMVNDVSGLPIIEATSDWTVNMYNFPNLVFQKTGSQVNINGTLRVSGSFILPLSQSVSPQTGSAYWSGSFLFVWDGLRYRSSSFA